MIMHCNPKTTPAQATLDFCANIVQVHTTTQCHRVLGAHDVLVRDASRHLVELERQLAVKALRIANDNIVKPIPFCLRDHCLNWIDLGTMLITRLG